MAPTRERAAKQRLVHRIEIIKNSPSIASAKHCIAAISVRGPRNTQRIFWSSNRSRCSLPVMKRYIIDVQMSTRKETTSPMTKEEALAYKAGYEAVNAIEIAELRSMSFEEKFEHAAALMASARQMGWVAALSAEDDNVRELWIRLKRAYLSGS